MVESDMRGELYWKVMKLLWQVMEGNNQISSEYIFFNQSVASRDYLFIIKGWKLKLTAADLIEYYYCNDLLFKSTRKEKKKTTQKGIMNENILVPWKMKHLKLI